MYDLLQCPKMSPKVESVLKVAGRTVKFQGGFMNQIVIAVIPMIGTLIGSFAGIITSSKLTSFRLEKLEQKVDMHNNFAQRVPVIEEQIKIINHRIDSIEEAVK